MKEHDYADAFKEKFDIEFQSEEFGFNHNIYIEGSTCDYHNKYHNDISNQGKVKYEFQSHFSDGFAQNAATTFEHTKKFIHWMYDNKLFIKGGIIYDTTDGCRIQYRCANTM